LFVALNGQGCPFYFYYGVGNSERNRSRCGFRNYNNININYNNNVGFRVVASALARAGAVFLRIHGESLKETPGVVPVGLDGVDCIPGFYPGGITQPNKKGAGVSGKTIVFERYVCATPSGVQGRTVDD